MFASTFGRASFDNIALDFECLATIFLAEVERPGMSYSVNVFPGIVSSGECFMGPNQVWQYISPVWEIRDMTLTTDVDFFVAVECFNVGTCWNFFLPSDFWWTSLSKFSLDPLPKRHLAGCMKNFVNISWIWTLCVGFTKNSTSSGAAFTSNFVVQWIRTSFFVARYGCCTRCATGDLVLVWNFLVLLIVFIFSVPISEMVYLTVLIQQTTALGRFLSSQNE